MAFLLFAVIASTVGIAASCVRNRRPNSMEHSIDEFERGPAARSLPNHRRADAGRPE